MHMYCCTHLPNDPWYVKQLCSNKAKFRAYLAGGGGRCFLPPFPSPALVPGVIVFAHVDANGDDTSRRPCGLDGGVGGIDAACVAPQNASRLSAPSGPQVVFRLSATRADEVVVELLGEWYDWCFASDHRFFAVLSRLDRASRRAKSSFSASSNFTRCSEACSCRSRDTWSFLTLSSCSRSAAGSRPA